MGQEGRQDPVAKVLEKVPHIDRHRIFTAVLSFAMVVQSSSP